MTGPTPKISVSVVPDARTAAVSLFLVSRIWASMRRRSSRNSAASSQRACGDGVGRLDCFQDTGRVSCGDLLGDAARDQLAQHGVQPADDLGPGPAQVPVALGPHLQHRRVVVGLAPRGGPAERSAAIATERASLGSFLFVVPGRQQPHPGAELGLHVEDPLAGRDQLLGQQVPQARGALDRPGPLRPGRRPRQQPLGLGRRGPHPHLAQRLLAPRRSPPPCASPCAGRHRSSLPPSTAPSSSSGARTVAGMPDFGSAGVAPLSSHATARPGGLARR